MTTSQPSYQYQVWIIDTGLVRVSKSWLMLPQGKGIIDIREGFWINRHAQYTEGFDAEVWIPPARIYEVVKVYS